MLLRWGISILPREYVYIASSAQRENERHVRVRTLRTWYNVTYLWEMVYLSDAGNAEEELKIASSVGELIPNKPWRSRTHLTVSGQIVDFRFASQTCKRPGFVTIMSYSWDKQCTPRCLLFPQNLAENIKYFCNRGKWSISILGRCLCRCGCINGHICSGSRLLFVCVWNRCLEVNKHPRPSLHQLILSRPAAVFAEVNHPLENGEHSWHFHGDVRCSDIVQDPD